MNARGRFSAVFLLLSCLLAAASAAASDEEAARLIAQLGLKESATALADRPGWTKPKKVVIPGADAARIAWMQAAAPGVTLLPAEDVKRLLFEKPAARGLTVPGMPIGSPGMEQGDRREPYDVLLVGKGGSTTVYAHHGD